MYVLKYLFYSSMYVKAIIIALIFMLVLILAFGLSKIKKTMYINAYIKEFKKTFWSGIDLQQFYEANKENLTHPLGLIFSAIMEEWTISEKLRGKLSSKADIKERMLNVAHVQKIKTLQVVEKYMDALGSFIHIAPFLGLLGTIFGMMDIFYNVDLENGLTIVDTAVGIGSSLITLVFSLLVVIISMIFFWFFNMKAQDVSDKIDGFIVDIIHIYGRVLDEQATQGVMPERETIGSQMTMPPSQPVKEAEKTTTTKPASKVVDEDDDI